MRMILLAIAAAYALSACVDTVALDGERATYCEMVKLHKQTGGELGWPDYRKAYATDCGGAL
mgnify:CR=1 FL=1